MYKGQIPFDAKTGDQLNYMPYGWREDPGIDWRPNEPFEAVMELCDIHRGRSAAHFVVKSNNRYYTLFMIDLMDVLLQHGINKGKTPKLKWCFCKRGQNYGVQLYENVLHN
jgi:hypothetical protein